MPSIAEQVRVNLYNTLSTITTENGYSYTLNVLEWNAEGNEEKHLNAVLVASDMEEEQQKTRDFKSWTQRYCIEVYITTSKNDTTPTNSYINAIWGDINNCLLIDRSRGGIAINTNVLTPQLWNDSASNKFRSLGFFFEVSFRHRLNDASKQ